MHQRVQTFLNSVNVGKRLIRQPVDQPSAQRSFARAERGDSPAKVLRTRGSESRRVNVAGIEIGGPVFVVIAGPCAVEGVEQMEAAASSVRRAGAQLLRG